MATVNAERAAPKKTTAPAKKAARKKAAPPAGQSEASPDVRVIKKYPNRRLYDTQASSYITLTDVKAMVLASQAFVVRDATDGHDLTRSILLQIILEEESGGVPMFSTASLEQIIRFYGNAMQGVMGAVLEQNLKAMVGLHQRFAEQATVLSPQAWSQMVSNTLNGSLPGMPQVMGGMVEQSKALLAQMQEQMAKGAGALFSGLVPPKK
jgi:polyhydroxyalkanoate synthesis repressor PhaR